MIKISKKSDGLYVWRQVTEFSADDFTDSYEALDKYCKYALDKVHKDKISQGGADFLVGFLIREVKDNADIDVVEDLKEANADWAEMDEEDKVDYDNDIDAFFADNLSFDPKYFEASYYC